MKFTYKFKPIPIASVATMILHESFGSLKRCACNNLVPEQRICLLSRIEFGLPGGNEP